MDLTALLDMQRELDADIEEPYPIQGFEKHFGKKVLALLVELGELARRWNRFTHREDNRNPLLEKYVDVLRLVLSLGNNLGVPDEEISLSKFKECEEPVVKQFAFLYNKVSEMVFVGGNAIALGMSMSWAYVASYTLGLGEMLGFTWEQIEAAYEEKVNQKRIKGTRK